VVYTPPDSFCVEPLMAPPNALALPSAARRMAGVRELGAKGRCAASMAMRIREATR
jgi:hypothetical protein